VENQVVTADERRFFCVDPRDGKAVFQVAKPVKVGLLQPKDKRTTLCSLSLPVDPSARPFLERLDCRVQIDHDYVARVVVESTGRFERVEAEVHDLDFGLGLPVESSGRDEPRRSDDARTAPSQVITQTKRSDFNTNVGLRSNVSDIADWARVPGDLLRTWAGVLEARSHERTELQHAEMVYYSPCAYCHRTAYEIERDGPVDQCYSNGCPRTRERAA